MDTELQELTKKACKGLQLVAELCNQAASLGYLADEYSTRYLNKSAYRDPQQSGMEWFEECLTYPNQFYKMFRVTPEVFWSLHDLLVSTYGLKSTCNVSSIESLAMFLWIVGGSQSFSQAENRFVRSLWTVHMKFKEVLSCLGKLSADNIKPKDPNFSTVHPKLREDRFWPHFKDAIGAIDGSHIEVSVPNDEVVNHTCRHGYTSQNIMAICDFDMRFTFVVAGWPGSAHDTRILNHALTNFGHRFPKPPAGIDASFICILDFLCV
jgi:hypothetical protein